MNRSILAVLLLVSCSTAIAQRKVGAVINCQEPVRLGEVLMSELRHGRYYAYCGEAEYICDDVSTGTLRWARKITCEPTAERKAEVTPSVVTSTTSTAAR